MGRQRGNGSWGMELTDFAYHSSTCRRFLSPRGGDLLTAIAIAPFLFVPVTLGIRLFGSLWTRCRRQKVSGLIMQRSLR